MDTLSILLAALTIVAPNDGSTVSLLNSEQRSYLSAPLADRRRMMDSAADRRRCFAAGSVQAPLRLAWTGAAEGEARVVVRGPAPTAEEFSVTNRSEVWLTNLELGARYVVSVTDAAGARAEVKFSTDPTAPRFLRADGVMNFRDLGGWTTADGRKVKQNLIFRSAGLRSSSKSEGGLFGGKVRLGANRVTPAGLATLRDDFRIKTDLELRTREETAGMETSLLAPQAAWKHVSFAAYGFIENEVRGREAFVKAFRVFADRRNYPILMHCSGGRDRTGTLAFLLNGLLGVGEEDLRRDWEASIFSDEGAGFSASRIDGLFDFLNTLPGKTLNDRIRYYAVSSGVEEEAIEAFREIMLGGGLERGFANPPMLARPQTWWHWMNGNVTRDGITADLEAMKEIGLGGATIFDAGCNVPAGKVKFDSREWYDLVGHAAKEARRLGLELATPSCSGWSCAGGTWMTPEMNMKELVVRETTFEGPGPVAVKLPEIPNPHGFAGDVAVLVVPVPAAEEATMEKAGVSVESPSAKVRVLRFREPFAADGGFYRLEYDREWQIDGEGVVEVSEDGERFTELCRFRSIVAQRGDNDYTDRYIRFPREVRARAFRLSFRFWDWVSKTDFSNRITLKDVRVGRKASLTSLQDKQLHRRSETDPDRYVAAADQLVARSDVRDASNLVRDGVLRWTAPAGKWRAIRVGYAANGRKNHPASDGASGYEADKLSAKAVGYHFDHYVAKLADRLGENAGNVKSGLATILVDSYEAGSQNWTVGLEKEFRRLRGYDMTGYLPVFAGVIVGSVEESERFLYDYRRTVADLFADNFAGTLAKKCHRLGLKLSLEPYGNCPCDDLEFGEYADVPQCEFWSWFEQRGDRCTDVGNSRMPAYIAHVMGRKYVGAEAFTSYHGAGARWLTTPFRIKAQGDRSYTEGVNRFVFHRFAHQPWVGANAPKPGMTMGPWGMHLDRTETWWKQGRAWMAYLGRCQYLLQEGRFAADVLFLHGVDVPNRGGHLVAFPQDYANHPTPAGYSRDVCSLRALQKLKVDRGKIVAPGGTEYSLLVLPPTESMPAEAVEKIGELTEAGAVVFSPSMPTKTPGLKNYPACDAKLAELALKVWPKVGEGGASEGFAAIGLAPDFTVVSAPDGLTNEVRFIHRIYPDGIEAYFVAVPNEHEGTLVCSFRQNGREPELWDAETGRTGIRPLAWQMRDGRTTVTLRLAPSGSAFVVFRKPTEATEGKDDPQPKMVGSRILDGRWKVEFPVDWYHGGSETRTVELDSLADWTTFADDDLKYFSGTATYTYLGDLDGTTGPVELDFGDVRDFADVIVDGKALTTLWKPPFKVRLERAPKSLVVKITNRWPNRIIGDERLYAADTKWLVEKPGSTWERGVKEIPDWVRRGEKSPTGRKTFTTWHHWLKNDKLLPSGLLGPVRFSTY